MLRVPRKVVTALRWIAAPLAFAGTFVVSYFLGLLLLLFLADAGRRTILALALVAGAFPGSAVLVGAWIAPRRPRWWIALMIGTTVAVIPASVMIVGGGMDGWNVTLLAAALLGTLGTSLLAWPGLPPPARRALLWASLVVVLVAQAVLVFVLGDVRSSNRVPGGAWVVADPLLVLVAALAVYGAGRIAPSHARRTVAVFAPALALLDAALTGPLHPAGVVDIPALPTIVGSLLGAAAGAWAIWRRESLASTVRRSRIAGADRRYKGMTPFQDASVDRRTFFGRDREARSLLSLVLAERLVVLFGKSGMGKTSLINAGLVEPLRERGHFPMVVRLADRETGPLGSLYDGVRAAARSGRVDLVEGDATSALSYFRTAEIWSQSDDLLRPVLILDQFEELFTLHDPGPRREFIRQLAELVRGPAAAGREAPADGAPSGDRGDALPDLKIVLALREDFLAELEELARDIPGVLRHRFRLGPFLADSAREAIVGPAALPDKGFATAAFSYRPEAVDRIVTFLAKRRQGAATVEGAEVEPAHLQLVCQYLEESVLERSERGDARGGAEITAEELGGDERLGRILEGFYDRTLLAIRSPAERRRVRKLCERRLISEGGRRLTEDGEEIERRLRVPEARLRQLVDARLLRSEPRLGGLFYELSHDTLVEPIRRSRLRRQSTNRKLALAGVLVLVVWLGGWFVSFGWAAIRADREKVALDELSEPLPRPGDPTVFETLARDRLDRIASEYPDWVASRALYGGMVRALTEVAHQHPTLESEAYELKLEVRSAFLAQNDLPLSPVEASAFGRSSLVAIPRGPAPGSEAEIDAFRAQTRPVSRSEYRRFDPSHALQGKGDEPAVSVSWYEAAAYADWLGGRLPRRSELQRVHEILSESGTATSADAAGEWLELDPDTDGSAYPEYCVVAREVSPSVGFRVEFGQVAPCQTRSPSIGFRVVFPEAQEPGAAE